MLVLHNGLSGECSVCAEKNPHLFWQLLWLDVPQVGALHHSDPRVLCDAAHDLTMPHIHAIHLHHQQQQKQGIVDSNALLRTNQHIVGHCCALAAAVAVVAAQSQLKTAVRWLNVAHQLLLLRYHAVRIASHSNVPHTHNPPPACAR